jgi:hypothetical protein
MKVTTLKIDLREGFVHEHVTISVNDQVIFDKPSVHTRLQIGWADSVTCELNSPRAEVLVKLPKKELTASTVMDVDKQPYLFVDLKAEKSLIEFFPSKEEGRYA